MAKAHRPGSCAMALTLACLLGAVLMVAGGCAVRQALTPEELQARVEAFDQRAAALRRHVAETFRKRVVSKQAEAARTGEQAVFDILLISSGGQYGAFGVGVLQGWGRCEECRRPDFDLVTGVSTGALIAPFAFLNTPESIDRIEQLYRRADPSLAGFRGVLYFLPWSTSFYDNERLEERIQREYNLALLEQIARRHDEDRLLLVSTTDLDLGLLHVWDLGDEARAGVAQGDATRFQQILLATTAIPAIFPPVMIDGVPHSDGGATQQVFVGLDADLLDALLRELQREFPGAPPPRARVWAIVNNKLYPQPRTINPTWYEVAKRSLVTIVSYAERSALRQIELLAQRTSAQGLAQVELRFIAIPDDMDLPPNPALFDQNLMRAVMTRGSQLGREMRNWRTRVGPAEWPRAEDDEP